MSGFQFGIAIALLGIAYVVVYVFVRGLCAIFGGC